MIEIFSDTSICNSCWHCEIDWDYKENEGSIECEEGMNHFGTEEGCYKYYERIESDD